MDSRQKGASDMIRLSILVCQLCCFVFLAASAICISVTTKAYAQEPQYSAEEYDAYQAITAEADAAKKMEMIAAFFKNYPKSALKTHVGSDFDGALKNLQDAKKWPQIATLGRQFLTLFPDDAYVVALVTAAYEETKNYAQLAAFGEELYKVSPTPELAYSLARAYRAVNNVPKLIQWAEKVVAQNASSYEMLFELARAYGDTERYVEADKYARQCLKVIQATQKPAEIEEKSWTDYSNQVQMSCYYIIGIGAFKRNDYPTTISNLESSLKFNPRNGTAYYYLAQSYWQSQKIDLALKDFAKAYLLGGQTAQAAKQYLDNLYKQTHKNSLVGVERVIEIAKAELK
jgi:predicted Zn-dependent protease